MNFEFKKSNKRQLKNYKKVFSNKEILERLTDFKSKGLFSCFQQGFKSEFDTHAQAKPGKVCRQAREWFKSDYEYGI